MSTQHLSSSLTTTKSLSTTPTTSSRPLTSISTSTTKISTSSTMSSTKSAIPIPTWKVLGCYSDNVNNGGRSLTSSQQVTGGFPKITVELCQSACKSAGYSIAGLEYSQECWCGNSFVNGGAYVGADGTNGCIMSCKGNSKEWCGGSNRLSAYKWG